MPPFRRRSFTERVFFRRKLGRVALMVVAAFLLASVTRSVFVATWTVRSGSMAPALHPGDRVASTALMAGPETVFGKFPAVRHPARGSLVVVAPPGMPKPGTIERMIDSTVRFFTLQLVSPLGRKRAGILPGVSVKRVVGLPGDTLRMRNWVFEIRPAGSSEFRNEFDLSGKHYGISQTRVPTGWKPDLPASGAMDETTLEPGEYFVAGDARGAASDSLAWGPVGAGDILGTVFLRYWPPAQIAFP